MYDYLDYEKMLETMAKDDLELAEDEFDFQNQWIEDQIYIDGFAKRFA